MHPTLHTAYCLFLSLVTLKGHFYYCGIKYKCLLCSTCFDSEHPDVLARLPDWVQTQLPVILTTNGAIDRDMMDLISYDVTNGQGFQASAERIATILYRQHAQNQLAKVLMRDELINTFMQRHQQKGHQINKMR